jgi:hypothetical protein
MLRAMEGQLRLKHLDGTVEMRGRVVEYVGDTFSENRPLFSWHGSIANYQHDLGELVLDDGRVVPVVVDHGLLRPM